MKLVFGLLALTSINVYAYYGLTEKNPEKTDISVNVIIDYQCSRTGDFNPAVCVDKVINCYNRTQWPKTIDVNFKMHVLDGCLVKHLNR